ncbi:MAG TPA: cell filamentation protein Fic [Alphaproteobacteria bacterium]|nr:cell filamentation protein Fic [Alphaproteobacteria bacterium]HAJ46154.1 cell filamentation protein Fic [Alphaproteobacteria bacterium]
MAVLYHTGKFPPKNLDWEILLPFIGPASAALARYEGVLHGVPNRDVLLSPLTSQEAVLSSRIEGTQATLGEVLEFEAEGLPNDESTPKRADIREVMNYRVALRMAVNEMRELPLSQRLIKHMHRTLMDGVRGRNKDPGEYRRIQNWIGPGNSPISAARFVPVGAENLDNAMSAWETYLHGKEFDITVQLAVLHAEFEAIHPFLDGNGRLGRLLVPLFLFEKKLLDSPNFYMSAFLERNRDEYYERLLSVSRDDDWTGWCKFFLQGLIEQANENTAKAQEILELYREQKTWIVEATKSQFGVKILDWIFVRPIFKARDVVETSGVPKESVARLLRILREEDVLTELRPATGRRPAIYAFGKLLNIAEGQKVV